MFKIAAPSLILGVILLPFYAPIIIAGLKIAVPLCVASVISLLLCKLRG